MTVKKNLKNSKHIQGRKNKFWNSKFKMLDEQYKNNNFWKTWKKCTENTSDPKSNKISNSNTWVSYYSNLFDCSMNSKDPPKLLPKGKITSKNLQTLNEKASEKEIIQNILKTIK